MATPILGRGATEWTLDDARFQRGVSRVLQTMGRLQARAERVGRVARNMLLIGGGALAGFVKLASDATETASKFEAVFREGTDAANEFAAALARSVGRSKTDIQEALSTFQGFFVGLGFATDKARLLSQQLTTLGIDFASFNNLADDEAIGRFISALSGSGEVLDRFGINIKQSALGAKLLEQGIKGGVNKANEQQKAIARLAIIMKAMTDQGAVGDAIRTSDQFANRMRALTSLFKDASVQIGNIFIPDLIDLSEKMTSNREAIEKWIEQNRAAIKVNTILAAKFAVLLILLPKIVAVVRLIIIAFTSATAAAGLFIAAIGGFVILGLVAELQKVNIEIEKMRSHLRNAARDWRDMSDSAAEFFGAGTTEEKLQAIAKRIRATAEQITKGREHIKDLQEQLQERISPTGILGNINIPSPSDRQINNRRNAINAFRRLIAGESLALKKLEQLLKSLQDEQDELEKQARAPGGGALPGVAAGAAPKAGLPVGQFFGAQALFKAIQQRVSGIDKDAKALKAAQDTSKNTKKSADNSTQQVSQLGAIHDVLRGGIGAVFT